MFFYVHSTENQVLECSALAPDLALLPAGDRTQIGEQGVSICKYFHVKFSLSNIIENISKYY